MDGGNVRVELSSPEWEVAELESKLSHAKDFEGKMAVDAFRLRMLSCVQMGNKTH